MIKKAKQKRASYIHFEPMENELRIRYRIDGELFTAGTIDNEKQAFDSKAKACAFIFSILIIFGV